MHLRTERPEDVPAIAKVIELAFADHPHSDHTEARIVERLRAAAALSVSIVAIESREIVGHVACSPVSIDGDHGAWFGLGPLAVHPALQGRGIGSALVRASIATLSTVDAEGVCLVGNPGYYARFGFRSDDAWQFPGVPAGYFLVFQCREPTQKGVVQYHAAFDPS